MFSPLSYSFVKIITKSYVVVYKIFAINGIFYGHAPLLCVNLNIEGFTFSCTPIYTFKRKRGDPS